MTRYLRSFILFLVVAALAACNASERQPAATEKPGSVKATNAFVKEFGPAPAVEKGTAYAFVIYFPSAKEKGKVLPFPFFSFDEASLKKVALTKLIGGLGDLKSYQGEIAQPFPPGTRLLELQQAERTTTAVFSKELAAAWSDQGLVNAVVLTLKQFEGVDRVVIRVEGAPGIVDKEAQKADQSAVLPLGPPRLLSVTGMKEKGAATVEEVDAFFDRPVQIKELRLSAADGTPFEGVIFQSVFDMAGVLKPKSPAKFSAGLPVKVRWNVTDKVGRNSSGETQMLLEVREH